MKPRPLALVLLTVYAVCLLCPVTSQAGPDWADRRPIGWLDIANENERRPEKGGDPLKNPEAWNAYWHRDPDGKPLDARDPDYVAKFAVAYKTNCFTPAVAIAKKHNGQSIVVRDWPGRRYDQPNGSYEGWPAGPRPPECTDDLLRWMAQTCKDNNIGLGFCVRHTLLLPPVDGRIENARQVPAEDPATVVIWKIQEARWRLSKRQDHPDDVDLSAVLNTVYWDTNVEANTWATGKGPLPLAASVVAKVQASVPGILLIPELGTLGQRERPGGPAHPEWGVAGYLAVPRVAPWREQAYPANPITLTASRVNGAFEVMMPTPNWLPTADDKARLVRERKAGHVFVFNATGNAGYEDKANALVDECEQAAKAN